MFSEKTLRNKDKNDGENDPKEQFPDADRYTIFHALFNAMKDKDKKRKHSTKP